MNGFLSAVKKRLASFNFTLLLIVAAFAVHRGVDPCETLFRTLTGVGVEDLVVEAPGGAERGPPAPGRLILELKDGQVVTISQNGEIQVVSAEE